MTDKKFKTIVEELLHSVAQGHDLNLISEAKQGDKGYVTEKLGRALIAVGPQIVRFTKPEHATTFRGVECGPGTTAKAVVKAVETQNDDQNENDQNDSPDDTQD